MVGKQKPAAVPILPADMQDTLDARRGQGNKGTTIFKVNIDASFAEDEPIPTRRLVCLAGMANDAVFFEMARRDEGRSLKSRHSAGSRVEDAPMGAPCAMKSDQWASPPAREFS